MLVFFIAFRCPTLMYKKQSFIKNFYGKSFDISEIILRVKSFLFSENRTVQKEVSFPRKCEEKLNWQLTMQQELQLESNGK